MGSNFSMGWLAPKEDLGPWGGGQGQGDNAKEPISLVLTERVFERWAQVHQDRVAGAVVGPKSLPKPGFVEDELSTEIGVGVVCDDIPGITGTAAAAGQEVMEGYQGREEHAVVILASSEKIDKDESPKLANVDSSDSSDNAKSSKSFVDEKAISGGGDGLSGDKTTPIPLPFANSAYHQQGDFPGQFLAVKHDHQGSEVALNHDINPVTLQGPDFMDIAKEESYLLPDITLFDLPNFDASVSPFISEFEVDFPNNLPLHVVTNMAKASFSTLPEVESTFTQSNDELDKINAEKNLDKCRKVEEFWSKKLDSEIQKATTKLGSDIDEFLQRAERVKKLLPPPKKNHECANHTQTIAQCYAKNATEVFKCRDVIEAFSKCVGQSEWPGMEKLQN